MTRLHPLGKILVSWTVTAASLVLQSPRGLAVLVFWLTLCLLFSFRCWRPYWRGLLAALGWIALSAWLFGWLLDDSGHALLYGLRLTLFLGVIPLTALTIRPADLVRALTQLGAPNSLTLALLLMYRFIPWLLQESKEIQQAASLHGRQLGRWRGWFLPILFSALDFSDKTAMALELRGFDLQRRRSSYRPPRWQVADLLWLMSFGLALVLACRF